MDLAADMLRSRRGGPVTPEDVRSHSRRQPTRRSFSIVGVGLLLAAAALWQGTVQTVEWSDRAMADEQKSTAPRDEAAGLHVLVEVGNEYVDPGRTRMEVHGDGRVTVANQFEGKEKRGEGKVDVAQLGHWVEAAARETSGWADLRRRGVPDEPRYRIVASRDGRRLVDVEMWRSDVETLLTLDRLIKHLEKVAERAIVDRPTAR